MYVGINKGTCKRSPIFRAGVSVKHQLHISYLYQSFGYVLYNKHANMNCISRRIISHVLHALCSRLFKVKMFSTQKTKKIKPATTSTATLKSTAH